VDGTPEEETMIKSRVRTLTVACAAMIAGVVGAHSAVAGPVFSSVQPPPGSEPSHRRVLENVLGGSWSASGLNFTSDGRAVMRVADGGKGVGVAIPTTAWSEPEDSLWSSGGVRAAADRHTFGWIDDTDVEPVFIPILDTRNFNEPVTLMLSEQFRWALRNDSTGKLFTSRASDNQGVGSMADRTFDQLVTYELTGEPTRTWLLFWEDRIGGQSADYDYNDAVIRVTAAIPSPGSGVLALIGLAIFGRRERRGRASIP
jgi:hypothetical protein